jgi:hypothetical protein
MNPCHCFSLAQAFMRIYAWDPGLSNCLGPFRGHGAWPLKGRVSRSGSGLSLPKEERVKR